jgi:hypothetical protein
LYGYAALLDPRVRVLWKELLQKQPVSALAKHPITAYGEKLMDELRHQNGKTNEVEEIVEDDFMQQFYGTAARINLSSDKACEEWGEYVKLTQKLDPNIKTSDFAKFLSVNSATFPAIGKVAKAVFTVPGILRIYSPYLRLYLRMISFS